MLDGISPYDGGQGLAGGSSRQLQRTRGAVRARVLAPPQPGGRPRIGTLFQSGAGKLRMPRIYAHDGIELVFINTAGGLTGGDHVSTDLSVDTGATVVWTSQASEKIYRSIAGTASIENRVSQAAGSTLVWLPQETILFDRASLTRRLDISLAGDARLLAIEPMVFGRTAMGEAVREGYWRDSWRLSLDGTLIHADETRLSGPIADILAKAGVAGGALGVASGVYAGPDAVDILEAVRRVAAVPGVAAGASLIGGHIVLRAVAADGEGLRQWIRQVLDAATGLGLPRTWNC